MNLLNQWTKLRLGTPKSIPSSSLIASKPRSNILDMYNCFFKRLWYPSTLKLLNVGGLTFSLKKMASSKCGFKKTFPLFVFAFFEVHSSPASPFQKSIFPILLQPNFFSSRQDGMKFLGQKKLLTYKPHPGVKASPNAKIQVSCWPQTFGGKRNGGRWRHPNRNKRVVKAPNGLNIERIFEWCVLFFLVFLPLFWKLSEKNKCDLGFF